MKIRIRVKASAKKEGIEQKKGGEIIVSVKEPPIEGRANEAVVGVLADYFGIPKSSVRLVSGARSKNKVFEI